MAALVRFEELRLKLFDWKLEQYGPPLFDAGFDDLSYLQQLDRARLVRTERQRAQKLGRQPHLVLIRYVSAVIGDPKGWPHRVFLVCVTVYALCLIATGCLQAHILETRVPGSATWQLIVYPIAGGVCGVVMANFTNGHAACTKNSRKAIIFHCVKTLSQTLSKLPFLIIFDFQTFFTVS